MDMTEIDRRELDVRRRQTYDFATGELEKLLSGVQSLDELRTVQRKGLGVWESRNRQEVVRQHGFPV